MLVKKIERLAQKKITIYVELEFLPHVRNTGVTNQTHVQKLMDKAKFTSAEGCVPPTGVRQASTQTALQRMGNT
jgi:hypothetical protein